MSHDDLATRIDTSFGEGPLSPPIDAVLRAGRARRRRRRMAGGGTVVVGAAALAVVAGVALHGGPTSADDRSLGHPAASPACAIGYDPDDALAGDWAYLGADGAPVAAEGAQIGQEIDNPLGRVHPASSAAVVMTCAGFERWYVLDQSAGGLQHSYGSSFSVVPIAGSSLQDWVDSVLSTHQIPDAGPEVVHFAEPTGSTPDLVGVDGATIVRQLADPDVGEAGGSDVARTAAAEVIWRDATYFVVAVQAYENGRADYAAVRRDGSTPTFQDFVDSLPSRYGHAG